LGRPRPLVFGATLLEVNVKISGALRVLEDLSLAAVGKTERLYLVAGIAMLSFGARLSSLWSFPLESS